VPNTRRSGSRKRLPQLRLQEMADIELLLALDEALGDDDAATAHDVARLLDTETTVIPENSIGARFAWLRRFGVLERNGKTPARWSFTEHGKALVHRTTLTQKQRTSLQLLKEHQPLALARAIGEHRLTSTIEKMTERELRYQREQA
jgi:hypothetical protein